MSNKKILKIMPLGDLHVGSNTFNEDLFNKWLEVAKTSKHKKIILMGDLIDFLDSDRFYKQNGSINANEQLSYVIDALKPFKKDIIANLIGNHGIRAQKKYDLNMDQIIGDALCVETTKSFHQDICIKKGKNPKYLRVFAQHESPSSKSTLLAMRRFIADMETIDSELFLGAHNHRQMFVSKIYRGIDYVPFRKHYCFTGSFLNYKGSYADNGKYSMSVPSFPVLTVDSEKNIQCRVYWGDGYESN